MEARGDRVLRFWNYDVMKDTETVLNVIWNALNDQEGDKEWESLASDPEQGNNS